MNRVAPFEPRRPLLRSCLPRGFGAELASIDDVNERFVTRGIALRGLAAALEHLGLYDRVAARLSAPVRELLDDPPLAIGWTPAVVVQYVLRATREVGGLDAVRSVGEQATVLGPLKPMWPVVEGLFRLLGRTPWSILRRLPETLAGSLTGTTFVVAEPTATTAAITVTYEWLHDVPLEAFVYWEGAFVVAPRLCRAPATTRTTMLDSPKRNAARIDVEWACW
jgi:hypothetical protein